MDDKELAKFRAKQLINFSIKEVKNTSDYVECPQKKAFDLGMTIMANKITPAIEKIITDYSNCDKMHQQQHARIKATLSDFRLLLIGGCKD